MNSPRFVMQIHYLYQHDRLLYSNYPSSSYPRSTRCQLRKRVFRHGTLSFQPAADHPRMSASQNLYAYLSRKDESNQPPPSQPQSIHWFQGHGESSECYLATRDCESYGTKCYAFHPKAATYLTPLDTPLNHQPDTIHFSTRTSLALRQISLSHTQSSCPLSRTHPSLTLLRQPDLRQSSYQVQP